MKEKLKVLLEQLNHGLVDRDETLKATLLTILAGENIVLVGPPGTGKSLIARTVAGCFSNDGKPSQSEEYFEYLLTKFSTPEEIFGPLSIAALKDDRFQRNTDGFLPSVRIAFLDEIFKASSSILNALLTILNERVFHNGAQAQAVPLQALIAASNELPTGQEELSALYDRFLVRVFVDYIQPEKLRQLFETSADLPEAADRIGLADLQTLQKAARNVVIPAEIVDAILRIWASHKETFKEDRRETLSDRRLKKVLGLLRISAATNGRSEVDFSDVFLLKNCLWNHPDNAVKVRDLINDTLRDFNRIVPSGEDQSEAPAQPAPDLWASAGPIKGYWGSGSASDPLRIGSANELMGLMRPEVGLQGYYFRQTGDIDCTALTSWPKIDFKGHYDGGGYSIQYRETEKPVALFNEIQAGASVSNLQLDGVCLAYRIFGSQITHCSTNSSLIIDAANDSQMLACRAGGALVGTGKNCEIYACQAMGHLVDAKAENCRITACKSGNCLVGKSANACRIVDCLVSLATMQSVFGSFAGVTQQLAGDSVVERCFVTGSVKWDKGLLIKLASTNLGTSLAMSFKGLKADSQQSMSISAGIALECNDSSRICSCAIGRFNPSDFESDVRVAKRVGKSAKLENNISIDNNPGRSDPNGPDGQSIPAAMFNQYYFEHTLGWDFKTVWEWDGANGRPELRLPTPGAGLTPKPVAAGVSEGATTDLLSQQLRANIWA